MNRVTKRVYFAMAISLGFASPSVALSDSWSGKRFLSLGTAITDETINKRMPFHWYDTKDHAEKYGTIGISYLQKVDEVGPYSRISLPVKFKINGKWVYKMTNKLDGWFQVYLVYGKEVKLSAEYADYEIRGEKTFIIGTSDCSSSNEMNCLNAAIEAAHKFVLDYFKPDTEVLEE